MMKVSVCIPFYNAAPYIATCAHALLNQKDVVCECVFVDDGSTDDGATILEGILNTMPGARERAHLLRLGRNCGRVAARRAAIEQATGDYVGFCDADDWVMPDCYAKLLAAAMREDADAAVCAYCDVDAKGEMSAPRRVAHACADPAEFVSKSFYSPGFNSLCNKIFRTSIARQWLDDAMPDLCVGEDLLMTMCFFSRAKRLAFVDEPLYCYRKTGQSVTREISPRTVRDMVVCVRTLARAFPALPRARLDVMRANVMWTALRCEALNVGELADFVSELIPDWTQLEDVSRVKRLLLPLCVKNPSMGRRVVRLIERVREMWT